MKKPIYLVFLFFVYSCLKDNSSPGHAESECASPTFKAIINRNLIFKNGSYWVFKDSLDVNFRDTLHFDGTQSVDANPDKCNKIETIHMSCWANWMPEYHYRTFLLAPDSLVTADNYQTKRYVKLFLPKGTLNNPCLYYDSLFVYDRYYYNVVRSDTAIGTYNTKNKILFYMNSEFGFLKNDVFDANNKLIARRLLYSKKIVR